MPPTDDPNEIIENASGLRFPTEIDISWAKAGP